MTYVKTETRFACRPAQSAVTTPIKQPRQKKKAQVPQIYRTLSHGRRIGRVKSSYLGQVSREVNSLV
jgi:hypothetical protein